MQTLSAPPKKKPRVKPKKCNIGMPCHGNCVSKTDHRTGKKKQCSGTSQGNSKQTLQWLLDKGGTGTVKKEVKRINKERVETGEGRLDVKQGRVVGENMNQYLTKQPPKKPAFNSESLEKKSQEALAIASTASTPEIRAKAEQIADKFKGLANRAKEWNESRQANAEKRKKLNDEKRLSKTIQSAVKEAIAKVLPRKNTDDIPTAVNGMGELPTIAPSGSVLEKPSTLKTQRKAPAQDDDPTLYTPPSSDVLENPSATPRRKRESPKLPPVGKTPISKKEKFPTIAPSGDVLENPSAPSKRQRKKGQPNLPPVGKAPISKNKDLPTIAPSGDVLEKPSAIPKKKSPKLPPLTPPQGERKPQTGAIPSRQDMERLGGKKLGQGQYGVVYQNGDRVIKYSTQGKIEQTEFEVGQLANKIGISPKTYRIENGDRQSALELEFVDGSPLADYAIKNNAMQGQDIDDGIKVMAKMHKAGISHNDLHPGNMIRAKDGELKVIDWGRGRTNDVPRILREIIRPHFIFQTIYSPEDGLTKRPYDVKGQSQLIEKYNKTRQTFIKKYGEDANKFPTGKKGQAEITKFYNSIFGRGNW